MCMKLKISEWGNSHGLRMSSAVMEHLNIKAGDEVEVNLTSNGIKITKKGFSLEHLKLVKQNILDSLIAQTDSVSQVDDPYSESDIAYIVIDINPCAPFIREVPKNTENSYATLADAKEAARKIIQASIAEAQKSLAELRQIGIDNIAYIAL